MHHIHHSVYEEKVNRNSVQYEWDEVAMHEGYGEGASGLGNNIRWIEDNICESEDDAYEYISNADKGWYDQLAVRFKDYPEKKKTKTIMDLEDRLKKATNKYQEMQSKLHYKNAKSQFIGCKSCGSKISNKHLTSNFCPVCGKDLRPQSTINAIDNARKNMEKLQKELKNKNSKKTGKPKIYWLVKVEYHS